MDNRPIRAGILGAGGMGKRFAACLGQIDEAEVVALCSRTRARADALNDQECDGSAVVYDDYRDMLNTGNLDVLFVCLPPFAHSGQVEMAAERGIHLFLEKPIALDVARAESMQKAAEASGVVTQVGHHMRFLPAVTRVNELIDEGRAGKPLQLIATYLCNSLHTEWWRDRAKSGGQILEQLIHMYDMARYLLGNPIAVSATKASLAHGGFPDYTVEDLSAAVVEFESGAAAAVSGTNNGIPGRWTGDVTLICERLTVKDLLGSEAKLFLHEGPDRPESVVEEIVSNDTYPYLLETRCFIDTVLGLRGPAIPISEGLEDLKLVTSVVKSAETKSRIVLDTPI